MRDLYMKTGQGFLLVFSITSPSSLSELATLREEIIRIKDDENVPIVIVGNKADLEESRAVPRAKGFSVSQRWGAPYYESSARTRSGSPQPTFEHPWLTAPQPTWTRSLSICVVRCFVTMTTTRRQRPTPAPRWVRCAAPTGATVARASETTATHVAPFYSTCALLTASCD